MAYHLKKKKKGYCTISPKATTGKCILPEMLPLFLGKICRVEEFDSQGGVLCLNENGSALGMFDKIDVINSFECDFQGNYILPPNLGFFERMTYFMKLSTRIGGYNNIVRDMVIVNSLGKGEYNDDFIFAKQNQDELNSLK